MKLKGTYNKRIFLGINNDGENIYYYSPSWKCGWYWSFGYLGNNNTHYHLESLIEGSSFDNIKNHFSKKLVIRNSHIWVFLELAKTAYALKETAEILERGGSHVDNNPIKDIIINKDEVTRINKTVLPEIFDKINDLLISSQDNDRLFKELAKIDAKGLTSKTIDFMFFNEINPDDIRFVSGKKYEYNYIEGINKQDWLRIHSAFWRTYHEFEKALNSKKY